LWFEFLGHASVSWDEAGAEDVARFAAWLRAPAGNVIVLAGGTGVREPATANRYLAGVSGFYDHHARTGLQVATELVSWRRISRGSYKPFLHHVTGGRPVPVRPVKLHVTRRAPRILEPGQIVAILAACEHLRDRFLLSLLAETGMRAGQALGLRHAGFVSRKREVHIVPRAGNASGARAKVRPAAVVPVSTPLVRLYPDYMHAGEGGIDSGYVFVNLFAGRAGAAMTYPAVRQLTGRIAARTGIGFTAGMLRHSHATRQPDAGDATVITRPVLEDYLSWLLTQGYPASTRALSLSVIRVFSGACHRHGWLPGLAASATIYAGELPFHHDQIARSIPEFVMAQPESGKALAKIPRTTTRHLVVVLIETGLRGGDACNLPFNPVLTDSSGWPCLRFEAVKVRSEQLIPLSAKAAAAIGAQQDYVREHWPAGSPWLFPGMAGNQDGSKPYSHSALIQQLRRWQRVIDLRDEAGKPVIVTGHQSVTHPGRG
jgi:integrase/recombinase XerD